MLKPSTLALDIVEAILGETLPREATLFHIAVNRRRCGKGQRRRLGR